MRLARLQAEIALSGQSLDSESAHQTLSQPELSNPSTGKPFDYDPKLNQLYYQFKGQSWNESKEAPTYFKVGI